jgi:hypothetical protein
MIDRINKEQGTKNPIRGSRPQNPIRTPQITGQMPNSEAHNKLTCIYLDPFMFYSLPAVAIGFPRVTLFLTHNTGSIDKIKKYALLKLDTARYRPHGTVCFLENLQYPTA